MIKIKVNKDNEMVTKVKGDEFVVYRELAQLIDLFIENNENGLEEVTHKMSVARIGDKDLFDAIFYKAK